MTDHIAGYEVNFRKRIGRGAIGNVYKAKDKDGDTIAAKQVDISCSERALVRELENTQKQKKLNHENIVKILHLYNEEDIWIFMEYIDGGDINGYSKNHFEDLQRNKVDVMIQMSRGLKFLHDLKIAHRDIKPENALIQHISHGSQILVKLTDFGLAKFQDPREPSSTMNTKLGTQNYMAPEFWDIKEDGRISYRKTVDIFALGLTFQAIMLAEKDQNLRPVAEGCMYHELGQPVGLVLLNRQKSRYSFATGLSIQESDIDLRSFAQWGLGIIAPKEDDSMETQCVKELIREATLFDPESRPTATMLLKKLQVRKMGYIYLN